MNEEVKATEHKEEPKDCQKAAKEAEVKEATKKEWARDEDHPFFCRHRLDRELFHSLMDDSEEKKFAEMKNKIVKEHQEQLKAGILVMEDENKEKEMTAQEFLKQAAEQREKCFGEDPKPDKKVVKKFSPEMRKRLEAMGIQEKPKEMVIKNAPFFVCRNQEDLVKLEALMKERKKKEEEQEAESETKMEAELSEAMAMQKTLDEIRSTDGLEFDRAACYSTKEAVSDDSVKKDKPTEDTPKSTFLNNLLIRQMIRRAIIEDEKREGTSRLPHDFLRPKEYDFDESIDSPELSESSEESEDDSEEDDVPELEGKNVEASTKWLMDQLAKLNEQAAEMKQMLKKLPGAPEESPEAVDDDEDDENSDSEDFEYQQCGIGHTSDYDDDLEDLNDGNLGGLKTLQESLQKRQI